MGYKFKYNIYVCFYSYFFMFQVQLIQTEFAIIS